MPRMQLKIMSVLVGLAIGSVVLTGFFAERELRDEIVQESALWLLEETRLVAELARGIPFDRENRAQLGELAARAAAASQARVSLIDPDGVVLVDSGGPSHPVPLLEDHALGPEVLAALQGRAAHDVRWSDELDHPLLSAALPVPASTPKSKTGIIRLSVGLNQVDQAIAGLRGRFVTAAAIALAVAIALSYLISSFTLRPIRELAEVVRRIAEGRPGKPLAWNHPDERGDIARAINQMADRDRERVQLMDEKGQLEAVLASMVEGVLVIDPAGNVILANPRLRNMFGLWGDVIGRPVRELIQIKELEETLREANCTDEILVRDLELSKPKESVLLMHVVGFPREGPRNGTVLVFHDVSEMRRVDQIRRDFIANASHELRTPLTAIQGFADTLSSGGGSPSEMRSQLEVIARNAQRLSDLIDDLLILSRVESGREDWKPISLDLGRLAALLMEDFRPQFERAELTARLHNQEDATLVKADPRAVEQVLTNLLTNAVRYTNPGGEINVRVGSHRGRVSVVIEDTGIGIPAVDLERVFERFYRVDQARSRAVGSTGLGLAIVRHLVASMGGEIQLESQLGQGTRFIITLPALPTD